MSNVKDMFGLLSGKVHFYLSVGGTPAVEIILREKEIIAEIKNPILALELGIQQLATRRKKDSYILNKLKASGYKIKIKYKVFELEV